MRYSRTIALAGSLIGVVVLLAIGTAGPLMSQVEQPTYVVERSEGAIEIRTYAPMIVAEASVHGDRTSAIRNGFRSIAGYIFGGNVGSQKVAMTAPVMQERRSDDPKAAVSPDSASAGVWSVRFVMPRKWSLAALPRPRDPRISLLPIPAKTFAVIRFSGLAGDSAIEARTRELSRFVAGHKLDPVGSPILAFFNPPWTLPFLRRNEVMVEVKQQ